VIVVDGAAFVERVARLDHEDWVQEQVADELIHAPHLIDLEVANALRNLAVRKVLSVAVAREALADFSVARVRRYPHRFLLERIWELRKVLSAYDASYVALAEILDAPLVTTDLRLARSYGHRARIVAP
jgi:predicted nucleic acid-binding protein